MINDGTAAMFAFGMGFLNGVFAMFSGSALFGAIGLGFAAVGWLLALR